MKDWYLNSTQWIYQISDNIICSHAGISESFLKNVCKHLNIEYSLDVINKINSIEPCELFGFTPCKLSDRNGDSATQPCTWIRPFSLLQHGIKVTHIVGHTPVKTICNIKDVYKQNETGYDSETIENFCNIWCCDCLENRKYLIIENGIFKPSKI